jgi:hypothetical protein
MFEQTTLMPGKPEEIEAGIRDFWDRVGPMVKQNAGFKGSCLLVDGQSGKACGVALFDTLQNQQAMAGGSGNLCGQDDQPAIAGRSHCIMLIIHS